MGKTKTAFIGEQLDADKPKKKFGKAKKAEVAKSVKPHSAEATRGKRDKGQEGRGKNYKEAATKIDKSKLYPIADAVALAKETSTTKFDGTIELHVVSKKEKVNEQIELPHSNGKSQKVEVATDSTIKKIEEGKIDFDILLATPDMMPKLVPHAKVLGPKGLMPNPKKGTVINDPKEASKFGGNAITIKTEPKNPLIHLAIGKVSQKDKELVDNINAVITKLEKSRILKAFLTSTMGPSVKVLL